MDSFVQLTTIRRRLQARSKFIRFEGRAHNHSKYWYLGWFAGSTPTPLVVTGSSLRWTLYCFHRLALSPTTRVTNAIADVSHHKLDDNSVSPAFVQPIAVSTVIHVDV